MQDSVQTIQNSDSPSPSPVEIGDIRAKIRSIDGIVNLSRDLKGGPEISSGGTSRFRLLRK